MRVAPARAAGDRARALTALHPPARPPRPRTHPAAPAAQLAPKNRELSPFDITQILMRAGLMQPQFLLILASRGCQLIEPPFKAQARIYEPRQGDGGGWGGGEGAAGGGSPLAHGFHPSVPAELLRKLGSPQQQGGGWGSPLAGAGGAHHHGGGGGAPPGQLPPHPGQPQQPGVASAPPSAAPRARSPSHLRAAVAVLPPPSPSEGGGGGGSSSPSPSPSPGGGGGGGAPTGGGSGASVVSTEGGASIAPLPSSASSSATTAVATAARAAAAHARAVSQAPPGTPMYRRPSSAELASVCFAPEMLESGIAFMHRPIVTQISRWDRLKGWVPLLRAWVDLKTRPDHWVAALAQEGAQLQPPPAAPGAAGGGSGGGAAVEGGSSTLSGEGGGGERGDAPSPSADATEAGAHGGGALPAGFTMPPLDSDRHRRMLRNACLVLAGPDPRAIADDPEGLEVRGGGGGGVGVVSRRPPSSRPPVPFPPPPLHPSSPRRCCRS